MANIKKFTADWSVTGLTVYCIIRREVDSYRLNDADGAFASAPADPYVSLAEDSVIKGRYELSESRTVWDNGLYTVAVYRQSGGSPAPASDTIIGTGRMYALNDVEVFLDTPPSLVKADTATIIGYIDTEITAIANAITALQTDLGDPSVDTTTIYAQLLLVKGYVDSLETAIAAHEAARIAMQVTLIAEHDATQVLIEGIIPFNILSATRGAIQVSYAKTGGTVEAVKGDTISIPYGPLEKNITGRKLYFAAKDNMGDTAYSIPIKEITAQVTSFTTFTGTIPLTSANLNLPPGKYYAEIESRDADGLSSPATELKFILKVVDQVIV